ncbi:MAG: fructose-6-phosphate aldolase [Candidatus Altiarchaeales archaeon]|nr:fructose-6-phosphate aldolase [Candidatus Altiarchaeales archaeon]
MKFFLDTANIEEIKKAVSWGLVDGVTTNPTLMAKEGRDFKAMVQEISAIVEGPISVEAIGPESEKLVSEAREYSRLSKNIVIKIPMTKDGIKAVRILSKEGVKTNVTLVFSPNQALIAAKAGATYVSPFIGRLDDIGQDGMQVVRDIIAIFRNYGFKTQVIVASIRHPMHVVEAGKTGADIATIPFNVLEKMFSHALTDAGIKKFNEDWIKVQKHGK